MTAILLVFGGLIAGLVAIYMVRPAFVTVRLSAARFFEDQRAAGRSTLRICRPLPTRSFFLRLAVLLALVAAIVLFYLPQLTLPSQQVGVWFIVDRSASMSTLEGDGSRMDLARAELKSVGERARESGAGRVPCFDLSAFDLSFQDVARDIRGTSELHRTAAALKPRPLGTDLNLVRQAVQQGVEAHSGGCAISQVVVVSDMPAPPWIWAASSRGAVWMDIAHPVGNIGVTEISSVRDPFSGRVEKARFQIRAFGPVREAVRVTVSGPGGGNLLQRELPPGPEQSTSVEFPTNAPGRYRVKVSPGGAYRYDDEAEIDVPAADRIQVDWRVGRRDLLTQLGWQEDSGAPDLRVLPVNDDSADKPAILVGKGFQPGRPLSQPIWAFWGSSPLLTSLNFDVAERLGMQPAARLPEGFVPVLTGPEGAVWLAQRESPRAAYVPGLPSGGDDMLARFSNTVFLNAARWVLERRQPAPLFRLTSPEEPEPKGNLLALHPDEGNTERAPVSFGSLDFRPRATTQARRGSQRFWPFLMLAAIGIFLAERRLSFFGGARWA
jgi:hypothetical protein